MLPNPVIFFESLFVSRLNRQVRELFASTIILNFAVAMVTIFEPVFIFLLFNRYYPLSISLSGVMAFYLAVYIGYFFTVPIGAKFALRFGFENSLAVASIFQIAIYFFLFASNHFPASIIAAAVAYIIAKFLYWPAYHANFAKFSIAAEQGRAISNLTALNSFILVIGPLIGGLILEFYGFKFLFVVVAVLMLVSNVPMLITKERWRPIRFGYWTAVKRVFSAANRRLLLANLGYGEELIALNIWPIFMYLFASDLLGLGVISAASVLISTLIALLIGRWTDKGDRTRVLRWGTVFYFFSWVLKLLAKTTFGVVLLDVYARVAKNSIAIPITATLYGDARRVSVMGEIIAYEMSLVIGKIIALTGCLILLAIFAPAWNAMFLLGAVMTVFYVFYKV